MNVYTAIIQIERWVRADLIRILANRPVNLVALASVLTLLGLTLMMSGNPTNVAAQDEPSPRAYITVVIAAGDDTVSWSDPDGCTSDYNTYLAITPGSNGAETTRTHIGSVTTGGTAATQAISYDGFSANLKVELYCGIFEASSDENILIALTDVGYLQTGTYSSAPLTALSVSSGTFSPNFDRGLDRYSVEVPNDVERVTLEPIVSAGYQTDFVRNPGLGVFQTCGWYCSYSYGDGETTGIVLSDANIEADGFQIDLKRGTNQLGIGVNKGSVGAGPGRLYYLTVTVENAPATGQPAVVGIAQVGQTMAADTSGISDADGMTNVVYSYQWLADGTEINGATGSTYPLQASNANKTIAVKVAFVDDAGYEETLTSGATSAVKPNVPATGAPTITGTAEVGQTLNADTSSIADDDGLDNATFTYQWIRSDGPIRRWNGEAPFISDDVETPKTEQSPDGSDIQGATGSTYTVSASDVGQVIKVRLSFTDDDDNVESLTSTATDPIPIEVAFTFSIEGTTVTCDYWNLHVENMPRKDCDDPISTEEGAGGDTEVEVQIVRSASSQLYKFHSYIYQVEDSLGNYGVVEANDLCFGSELPETVSIEATPGDGSAPFTYTSEGTIFEMCPAGTYQLYVPWYRYNYDSEEFEYAGAFRRYFYINENDEVDTSIERVRGIKALFHDPPFAHGDVQIEATKQSTRLNRELTTFSLSISGLVPDSDPETTDYVVRLQIGGDGSQHGWEVPWCHVGDVGYSYLLKTVPQDGQWTMDAHVLGSCLRHWWPDTLRIELFDGSDLTDYSKPIVFDGSNIISPDGELVYPKHGTHEFIAGKDIPLGALPNAPATGVPTINGTAQVGETLDSSISDILDDDGLNDATFSYQWIRNDYTTDSDIAAAAGSTYTLVSADEGKTIKVRLSFTDDAGNQETLTSDETGTVQAAPAVNAPATGVPTIGGTAQVGEALTTDTSGVRDEDGLDNAVFSYQWLADDAEIEDATASTYTLVSGDVGKTIKVRVSFTDDAGNEETLTSEATAEVLAIEESDPVSTGSPPGVPTGLAATPLWSGIMDLEWDEVDDADSYDVQYFEVSDWVNLPGDDIEIAFYGAGAVIQGLNPDGPDYFRVRAVNAAGTSEWSDFVFHPGTRRPAAWRDVPEPTNSAATGLPTINGTAEVGETLAVDISGIADENGLERVWFYYQWTRDDGNGQTDIEEAADPSYTLAAKDVDTSIRVRVSFVDRHGFSESLTSAPTSPVQSAPAEEEEPTPPENNPATGVPTIGGIAQVGETLTADTSGIQDEDGLTNAVFSYQWVSNDGTADADIPDATGSSYTLLPADYSKTIKVRVSFTDDAGNEETVISSATDEVSAIWAATLRVGSGEDGDGAVFLGYTGFREDWGEIAPSHFGLDEKSYFVSVLLHGRSELHFGLSGELETSLTLVVGSQTFTTGEASCRLRGAYQYSWEEAELDWTAGEDVQVALVPANEPTTQPECNRPATGSPGITGTAQVGGTLTVDTSGISDGNGVTNATFTYQWIRVDTDSTETDISGVAGSEYTLVADDQGKTIKVRVSFTDDAGYDATLTSAGTAEVEVPLTATFHDTPSSHDGQTDFTFELRFSEEFELSFRTLRDQAFTVTDGTVAKARRLTKGSNVGWQITVRPDGEADVTVTLLATTDCTADGAICTEDGRMLSNSSEFTVSRSGG